MVSYKWSFHVQRQFNPEYQILGTHKKGKGTTLLTGWFLFCAQNPELDGLWPDLLFSFLWILPFLQGTHVSQCQCIQVPTCNFTTALWNRLDWEKVNWHRVQRLCRYYTTFAVFLLSLLFRWRSVPPWVKMIIIQNYLAGSQGRVPRAQLSLGKWRH